MKNLHVEMFFSEKPFQDSGKANLQDPQSYAASQVREGFRVSLSVSVCVCVSVCLSVGFEFGAS